MEVYKKVDGNLLRMDTNHHPLMTKKDYIESIEYSCKNFPTMPTELTRILYNFIEDWLQNRGRGYTEDPETDKNPKTEGKVLT